MEGVVLEVRDLRTWLLLGDREVVVVDGLSFCLRRGRTLALVGESGCGKTMAALTLMGLLPAAAVRVGGSVWYGGEDLLTVGEARMRRLRGGRVAMIFQDPTSALNPVYTVGEQILEVVSLHLGVGEEEGKALVLEALEEVGVPSPVERYDEYPHQLSGGLKQRVMIAMTLVCRPDVLIADEPTTALDVTIQAQVLELIRRLQEKRGMALLLITHDMGVVAEMADDVIVMYASQGVEVGDVYDIFDRMAHPYTRGLFESRAGSRGELRPIRGQVPPLGRYPEGCHFHPRCPYVMEKCRSGRVPDFRVQGEGVHLSRCLLHDGSVESAERLVQLGGWHGRPAS